LVSVNAMGSDPVLHRSAFAHAKIEATRAGYPEGHAKRACFVEAFALIYLRKADFHACLYTIGARALSVVSAVFDKGMSVGDAHQAAENDHPFPAPVDLNAVVDDDNGDGDLAEQDDHQDDDHYFGGQGHWE